MVVMKTYGPTWFRVEILWYIYLHGTGISTLRFSPGKVEAQRLSLGSSGCELLRGEPMSFWRMGMRGLRGYWDVHGT